MKNQLNNLLYQQATKKQKWLNDKNIYISIIYKDILQHKNIKDIHKDLYNAIINPNRTLLQYNLYLAKRLKRLDKGAGQYYNDLGLAGLAIAMLEYIDRHAINNQEHHIITREIVRSESDTKDKILNDSLKETATDKKVFFVASSHDDCAEDHLAAQGKIYIDQNWMNIVNPEDVGRVREYIARNNIDTMQYIINAPVYFITRPNCRHYFVRYGVNDILNGNYTVPHRHIGARLSLQTPRKANYEYYSDRLKLYKKLNAVYKTQDLDNKITKTKILIKKYKKR